jgi:hypothetical protein
VQNPKDVAALLALRPPAQVGKGLIETLRFALAFLRVFIGNATLHFKASDLA